MKNFFLSILLGLAFTSSLHAMKRAGEEIDDEQRKKPRLDYNLAVIVPIIPIDVWQQIIEQLSPHDAKIFQQVCKAFLQQLSPSRTATSDSDTESTGENIVLERFMERELERRAIMTHNFPREDFKQETVEYSWGKISYVTNFLIKIVEEQFLEFMRHYPKPSLDELLDDERQETLVGLPLEDMSALHGQVPEDIWLKIFDYLGANDRKKLKQVCRLFLQEISLLTSVAIVTWAERPSLSLREHNSVLERGNEIIRLLQSILSTNPHGQNVFYDSDAFVSFLRQLNSLSFEQAKAIYTFLAVEPRADKQTLEAEWDDAIRGLSSRCKNLRSITLRNQGHAWPTELFSSKMKNLCLLGVNDHAIPKCEHVTRLEYDDEFDVKNLFAFPNVKKISCIYFAPVDVPLLPSLTKLSCAALDGVAEEIVFFSSLTSLSLRNPSNEPHGMNCPLAALTNLTKLKIEGFNDIITDAHLVPLTNLNSLTLSQANKITDDGIGRLTNLKMLVLEQSPITGNAFSNLTSLTSLAIHDIDLESEETITTITNLVRLKIEIRGDDDQLDISNFLDMPKLRELNLVQFKNCSGDDACAEPDCQNRSYAQLVAMADKLFKLNYSGRAKDGTTVKADIAKLKTAYEDGVIIHVALDAFKHLVDSTYIYDVDTKIALWRESNRTSKPTTMSYQRLRTLVEELAHLVLGLAFHVEENQI